MDAERAYMFEIVFNQMTSPVTIIKPDAPAFTILAMNAERAKSSHLPLDQVIGKSTFDVFKPWDKASEEQLLLLRDGLNDVIHNKKALKLPVLYFEIPIDGTLHRAWVQVEVSPVLDAKGDVEFLLSIGRNVTEQQLTRLDLEESRKTEAAMRDELAAANEELRASNEELQTVNEELACLNEELAVTNEQLLVTNELLDQSRLNLQELNTELEDRINQRTKALTESETRFRTIFESMTQMAWTTNNQAEATFFNKRWYDFTGLNFDQSKGYGWKDVLHPDDAEGALVKFRDMQNGAESSGTENRFKGVDGKYRWHLTRMVPVKNNEGHTEMWIGTATEIHELKELQQHKDDFISIASHELKTPITTLNASLQLLDKLKDQPQTNMLPKLVTQARRSMQKVTTLVDDLLNLGRLQQQVLALDNKIFRLSELVSLCCNPISLAGKHEFDIVGDKALQVYADEQRIEQVILNLVNNAIKYAPDSKLIVITIQKVGNYAKLTVIDKGPGILPEKVPHLFDRYYRVDSKGYHGSGLGLGLYISYEIIKRHRGEMGVESEIGKGSEFWFTLPLTGFGG